MTKGYKTSPNPYDLGGFQQYSNKSEMAADTFDMGDTIINTASRLQGGHHIHCTRKAPQFYMVVIMDKVVR